MNIEQCKQEAERQFPKVNGVGRVLADMMETQKKCFLAGAEYALKVDENTDDNAIVFDLVREHNKAKTIPALEARHLAETIKKAIAIGRQSKKVDWISVEDRLPEYEEKVLVIGEQKGMNPQMGGAYTFITQRKNLKGTSAEKQIDRLLDKNHFHANYVTHWMPLPPKPIIP